MATEPIAGQNEMGSGESGAMWVPPHAGREALAGLVWLPRLIDKGRRVLEGQVIGRDLLGEAGYLFGVNDVVDGDLLKFLGLTNDDVLEVLRREGHDAGAASELVRRSGRSAAECATWSARPLRSGRPFLAMMDADEGRRPPGVGTTLLRFVYNGVIMPPTYLVYQRAERRRLEGAPASGASGNARIVGLTIAGGTLAMGVAWWLIARRRDLPWT